MQNLKNAQSKTEIQIKQKVCFTYEHLIKLGYPKILELSLSKPQQIATYLSAYFQCTPSRIQLVEWLTAIICPEYRQMLWYITEKDPSAKIIKSLWKIGVMPVNKHTKNLDYKKYVQAMLGYQNSVNLIFNLTELAFETVLSKKSKNDVVFGQFFHDLIQNYTELVNQNYDVYGITFPCKFVNPNQIVQKAIQQDQEEEYLDEFQKQYQTFYQQKMLPLLEREDELLDKIYGDKSKRKSPAKSPYKQNNQNKSRQQQGNYSQLAYFIDKLGQYGRQYHAKYSKLVSKIQNLLQNPATKSRLMPYYLQRKQELSGVQTQKKSVKQSIQDRSIRISPQFCRKYQQYKRTLRQIKASKDDPQFMEKRNQILASVYKINQGINL